MGFVKKGTRIISAKRTAAEAKGELDAWIEQTTLDLGGGDRKWMVVPGLFAGGGLDVMTSLLLDQLAAAALPPGTCVLDFGCGSGTLAAGLIERCQATATLLDSD